MVFCFSKIYSLIQACPIDIGRKGLMLCRPALYLTEKVTYDISPIPAIDMNFCTHTDSRKKTIFKLTPPAQNSFNF